MRTLFIACSYLLFGAAGASAQDGGTVAVEVCDRAAASPNDDTRPKTIRGTAEPDPAIAVPICQEAVKLAPDIARLHYQLGRALCAMKAYESAKTSFERAIAMDHSTALVALGQLYEDGLGTVADAAKARALYDQAAAKGNISALYHISWLLKIKGDLVESTKWVERGATAGDPLATYIFGLRLDYGEGIGKDQKRARLLYEKASDAGMLAAMNNLGVLLMDGKGGDRDYEAAKRLFKLALSSVPLWETNEQAAHTKELSKENLAAIEKYEASNGRRSGAGNRSQGSGSLRASRNSAGGAWPPKYDTPAPSVPQMDGAGRYWSGTPHQSSPLP